MNKTNITFGLIALIGFASGTACAEPMRGLLVFGHETRTLQLCGADETFWVDAPEALRTRLETRYRAVVTRPYEAVCAKIEGKILDQPAGAFAADYDGTIGVSELHSISTANACCSGHPAGVAKPPASAEAKTYLFRCDERTAYTVRTTTTEAWVFRPEGTLQLPALPAERGTNYSDGAFALWIEGEQARLGETDGELRLCQNDRVRAVWERAKLDGADFRAVGNEPGWHLEIQAGRRIVLVADYGASRVELPLPEPTLDPESRRTRWDAGELVLEMIGLPCRDSMSGEQFETRVVVTWRGQTLRGCGRALH